MDKMTAKGEDANRRETPYEIAPMVSQFEHHPHDPTPALYAFCRQHDIQFEAYSPLDNGAFWNDRLA